MMRWIFALLCLTVMETTAQPVATDSLGRDCVEKKQSLGKRLDKKLTTKYFKVKTDTNYVVRPKEK